MAATFKQKLSTIRCRPPPQITFFISTPPDAARGERNVTGNQTTKVSILILSLRDGFRKENFYEFKITRSRFRSGSA